MPILFQVNVAVHPDDTDDSDVDHLAVKKKVEVNEANKSLFLSVGLLTLADVGVISSPQVH